jgi:hypothetical protein
MPTYSGSLRCLREVLWRYPPCPGLTSSRAALPLRSHMVTRVGEHCADFRNGFARCREDMPWIDLRHLAASVRLGHAGAGLRPLPPEELPPGALRRLARSAVVPAGRFARRPVSAETARSSLAVYPAPLPPMWMMRCGSPALPAPDGTGPRPPRRRPRIPAASQPGRPERHRPPERQEHPRRWPVPRRQGPARPRGYCWSYQPRRPWKAWRPARRILPSPGAPPRGLSAARRGSAPARVRVTGLVRGVALPVGQTGTRLGLGPQAACSPGGVDLACGPGRARTVRLPWLGRTTFPLSWRR